jgi:rRNA maturation endonuclease Nob1
MPRYECPECNKVFCGWVMKYKYKNKCPVCGGELREVYDDNKKFRRDMIAKVLKTRKNLRRGNL